MVTGGHPQLPHIYQICVCQVCKQTLDHRLHLTYVNEKFIILAPVLHGRNDEEHDHDPDNVQLRVHCAGTGPVRHPHLPDGQPHNLGSRPAVLRYGVSEQLTSDFLFYIY